MGNYLATSGEFLVAAVIELARDSRMKVAYSQDTHDDGDPAWKIWPERAKRGTWGWQTVDELARRENEGSLGIDVVRLRASGHGTE